MVENSSNKNRRLIMKFFALVLLLISFNVFAIPSKEVVHKKLEEIREKFPNVGMAVGIVSKDKVLLTSFHGEANIDTQSPINNHSLFMIGSTTKAFTSTALGSLVQRGKLDWDQRVQSIIPEFDLMDPIDESEVTVRDLLLHRTGLPRHDLFWLTQRFSMEQFLELLPLLEPTDSLRTKWQYNNLMYMVAGMTAGRANDSHWSDVVKNNLLGPLEMNATYFSVSDVEGHRDLARPYIWTGEAFIERSLRNIDGIGPAGSIHSNMEDMAKWLRMNMNHGSFEGKQVVAREVIDEIHRGQVDVARGNWFPELTNSKYGFAWMTANYRGIKVVRHGGSINSYLTHIAFFPEKDLGIIILTNGGSLRPSVALLTLSDMLLELEPIDWVKRYTYTKDPVTIPQKPGPESLEVAVGEYEHPAYGKLTTSVLTYEGKEYLQCKLNGLLLLTVPVWYTDNPRVWEYDFDGNIVKIYLDEDGKVEKIDINFEPAVSPIPFERQE